jgi:dipeptidyl aminopeptidase/acylaminoacyl peptidase
MGRPPQPTGAYLLTWATVAVAAASAPAHALAEGRRWTLDDQMTVPELRAIAIAADGDSAAYVTRVADRANDKTVARLTLVDLKSGASRELLRAAWIDQLRRIPGSKAWSALIDRGDGVQLYQIEADGQVAPIIVHPATVRFGEVDGWLLPGFAHAPLRIGVKAYSWSPDGRWLFYVVLDGIRPEHGVQYDERVVEQRGMRRPRGQATASLYLRAADGSTQLVSKRPRSDLRTLASKGDVNWTAAGFEYVLMDAEKSGRQRKRTMAWSFAEKRSREIGSTVQIASWMLPGPRGGSLAAEGLGDRREIIETDRHGKRHSYGHFPFSIGHGAAFGGFRTADGRRAVVNARTIEDARYGIAVIETKGLRTIWGEASLTKCDFTPTLDAGACVAEGQTMPPAIVTVDVDAGKVKRIASVSPQHGKIEPLKVTPKSWVNRYGHKATGYVVWPRAYDARTRYPAIIVTHGTDADQRFADQENQWEYPVQMLAERGYVVLLVNDPATRQNAEIRDAYDAWTLQRAALPPEDMRKLLWLSGVASFEAAVEELVAEGIIDKERVGIAGYSRGSQMVNVAMTHSTMFRAASSGDGAYLEPVYEPDMPDSYHAVFGGSPYDPKFLPNYLALSPSLRAGEACGAILQQVAAPHTGAIDFYKALRTASVPAQLSHFAGEDGSSDETHIFHIPSNRMAAMQENIAWFDYWLKEERDPALVSASRYAEWDRMKSAAPTRCRVLKEPA